MVQAWRASGESAFRFARANGVALNSLKRWADAVPEAQRFVRLEVAPAAAMIAVQVGGARVVVAKGFDRALLRAVVEALS